MPNVNDAFTRQQIYLEFVKNDQAAKFTKTDEVLRDVIGKFLVRLKVDSIGDLPKAQVRALVAKLNKELTAEFGRLQADTTRDLRIIFDADVDVTARLMTNRAKVKFNAKLTNRPKLWAGILSDPLGAIGETPDEFLTTYFAKAQKDITKAVWRAYADKLTSAELKALFFGTKASKFKTGLLRTLKNNYASVTDTLIQHASSFVANKLGATFFDKYEWVSILDSATTEICRSRDGKIYKYGKGPTPPAHHRCRSRIRPITPDLPKAKDETYFSFLKGQPASFQDDVLGKAMAAQLRNGKLTAGKLGSFSSPKRLTAAQYLAKLKAMLT